MHHPRRIKIKALVRLIDHGLYRFFGHARIVFQFHGLNLVLRRPRQSLGVTHRAYKTAHRAHTQVLRSERHDFLRQVEIGRLHHHTLAHGFSLP